MTNEVFHKLIDTGTLEGKRIFSTNTLYKRFLKSRKNQHEFKPKGLWYAIGSSWFEWCMGENFGGLGKYIYEVELNPKANILFLTTKKEVFSFSEKYKRQDAFFKRMEKSLKEFASVYIDWEKVSEDYDGIEVDPYSQELRLNYNLSWYYGWDVPSGCIWKAITKKRLTLIAEYNQRKKEFVIL